MSFGKIGKKREPRPELILHPQIPKPLHGVAPRVVMGQAWWDEVRHKCYRESGQQCACCAVFFKDVRDFPRPEAHETYSIDYKRGKATFTGVVALCHWCHMAIHVGMAAASLEHGEMSPQDYEYAMAHREKWVKLALEAGHQYIDPGPGEKVCWQDWRLIVGDKIFAPKHKSIGAYMQHYEPLERMIEAVLFGDDGEWT